MVRVTVGDDRAGDRLSILCGGLLDRLDVPGRVDHRHLLRAWPAEEVDKILHRTQWELPQIQIGSSHSSSPQASQSRSRNFLGRYSSVMKEIPRLERDSISSFTPLFTMCSISRCHSLR